MRNPLQNQGKTLAGLAYIYTVSQKKLHKLFLSELRQISINFNNFW